MPPMKFNIRMNMKFKLVPLLSSKFQFDTIDSQTKS